jgi:methylenetetrahydrofolate reductase (NADPH)
MSAIATPQVSFEFFPPRTPEMEDKLWRSLTRLAPLDPRFVSVTYGAGGSTRTRTHATVARIVDETPIVPAAHLTCVGASRDEVNDVALAYWDAGVRHIVAIRGDPAPGDGAFTPHPDGYRNAAELVEGLAALKNFNISVGCHPEVHPEAASAEADLDNLKRKVDAGASRAITQFFFDNSAFLRFRDRAVAAGITIPILAGIMPVTNYRQVLKFGDPCGVSIPDDFAQTFEGLDDQPDIRKLVAADIATEQCKALIAEGVSAFHFYTLNRASLTYAICHMLGLRPTQASPQTKDGSR